MKIVLVLIVILLIGGLVGGGIEYAPQISEWWEHVTSITENTPETIAEYESLFNRYRVDNGEKPLEFTEDLNRVAALRLAEIQVDFSHNSAGHYGKHLSENIVKGIHDNESALDCWDGSILHKGNMLGSDDKYTGYATEHGYAVQVFSSYETVNGVPQLPPGWHWPDD